MVSIELRQRTLSIWETTQNTDGASSLSRKENSKPAVEPPDARGCFLAAVAVSFGWRDLNRHGTDEDRLIRTLIARTLQPFLHQRGLEGDEDGVGLEMRW